MVVIIVNLIMSLKLTVGYIDAKPQVLKEVEKNKSKYYISI